MHEQFAGKLLTYIQAGVLGIMLQMLCRLLPTRGRYDGVIGR